MGKSKVSRIYFCLSHLRSVIRFDFQCCITDQDFISSSYLFILRNSIILDSIFEPKDLSKVSSIQHGKHNEVIVRSLYARKMQKQLHKNFTVYDCGLVTNPSHPYLGASPDGKVFDPSSTSPFESPGDTI